MATLWWEDYFPFEKKEWLGHLHLLITDKTTIYICGGEPFPEERTIYWNFVASTKEFIEQTKEKWLAQTFEKIPGETEFVPLPEQIKKQ